MTADERIIEALTIISRYAGCDGAMHKSWVIDQAVRVLATDYDAWVRAYEDGVDGSKTYKWDEGVAP